VTTEFERYMILALEQARFAEAIGDVPIGAIVVRDGVVIGSGYNRREADKDPTAHAEILAIREASKTLGGWRLTGCELYVTIEPCPMCAGAIVMARLDRVVFGARDIKAGAVASLYQMLQDERLNHQIDVVEGILETECSMIIKQFFRVLRKNA